MNLENRFGSLKPVFRIRDVFPDPTFFTPDPGFRVTRSRIRIRIEADPGSWIWIFSIPDSGVKKAQDPESGTIGKT
jgi:hypothetical protein